MAPNRSTILEAYSVLGLKEVRVLTLGIVKKFLTKGLGVFFRGREEHLQAGMLIFQRRI